MLLSLHFMQEDHPRWEALSRERWAESPLGSFIDIAQALAGGWMRFFLSKIQQWDSKPTPWEVRAALQHITSPEFRPSKDCPTTQTPANSVFSLLIDSSASVTNGKTAVCLLQPIHKLLLHKAWTQVWQMCIAASQA